MSLIQTIRDKIKLAMKSGNEVERNVLRLIVGECDTMANSPQQAGKPISDEQVSKILRKVILSNNETVGYNPPEEKKNLLLQENSILESLLPKLLTQDEIKQKISSIESEIKSARSEGQAVGVAMKLLKQTNEAVDGNDVKAVVVSIRS